MNEKQIMALVDTMFNLGREFESYAVNWDQENMKIIKEKSLRLSERIKKEIEK